MKNILIGAVLVICGYVLFGIKPDVPGYVAGFVLLVTGHMFILVPEKESTK